MICNRRCHWLGYEKNRTMCTVSEVSYVCAPKIALAPTGESNRAGLPGHSFVRLIPWAIVG